MLWDPQHAEKTTLTQTTTQMQLSCGHVSVGCVCDAWWMCLGSVAVTVESVWPFFWRVWIYPLAGNTSEPSIICLASWAGQDFPSRAVFCKKMLTPWDLLLIVVVRDLSKVLTETRQARVMLLTCLLAAWWMGGKWSNQRWAGEALVSGMPDASLPASCEAGEARASLWVLHPRPWKLQYQCFPFSCSTTNQILAVWNCLWNPNPSLALLVREVWVRWMR